MQAVRLSSCVAATNVVCLLRVRLPKKGGIFASLAPGLVHQTSSPDAAQQPACARRELRSAQPAALLSGAWLGRRAWALLGTSQRSLLGGLLCQISEAV